MGAPDLRHEPTVRSAAFVIPEERLLPAVCPHCGAAGSVPVAVPADHPEQRLVAHLCDLCAGHAARQATLRFAWFVAALVVGISAASAMTFMWGERGRVLQLVALSLITLSMGQIARLQSNPSELRLKLTRAPIHADRPEQRLLISASPWLNRALVGLDFTPLENERLDAAQRAFTRSWWVRWLPFAPALFSCVWWLGLQGFSRASVYVLNMGPGAVVLLVDDRRQGTIAATRFEHPNLGYRHELVAGARSVRLVTSAGATIYSQEQRLLPGQTLLIARLMAESCVWEERLDYEHPGSSAAWSVLARSTQAVLLNQPVDAWFTPLSDGSATPQGPSAPGAQAAPGTRIAVRLLPCPTP